MSEAESKISPAEDPWMPVDQNTETSLGDARALAFLEEGPRTAGPAPAWLDQVLGGRLAVAVCRPASGRPPQGNWLAVEEVAPGCFALACEGDESAVAQLVRAVRGAGGVAAVALGPGGLGHNILLGAVPDRAAALFSGLAAARRTGVRVDEAALAVLREPALPDGTGFLLRASSAAPTRRGTWLAPALALAAAVLLGFGVYRLVTPPPLTARIYQFGEHARLERGSAAEGAWQAGDEVVVALEGEPGTHATVLLLDSTDRLVVPEATAVNVPLGNASQPIEIKKVFDDQPGREQFIGVISRQPLADLPALLERLNAAAGDRATRLAALADALGSDAVVAPAAELEHR